MAVVTTANIALFRNVVGDADVVVVDVDDACSSSRLLLVMNNDSNILGKIPPKTT